MRLAAYLLRQSFVRFALVGAGGYIVDTTLLWLDTRYLGLNPYSGRVLSILGAMIFTWLGNRTVTFAERAAHGGFRALGGEYLRFVGANMVGALANYGLYAWLVHSAGPPFDNKFLAQACGVLTGLVFNFTLSHALVFRGSRPRI